MEEDHKKNLEQILPKKFYEEIQLGQFYTIRTAKKQTGIFLTNLKEKIFPLKNFQFFCEDFRHLKRVKNEGEHNYIVLFKKEENDEQNLIENLEQSIIEQIEQNGKNCPQFSIEIKNLPLKLPVLKLEELRKMKIWGLVLKENKLQKYKEPIELTKIQNILENLKEKFCKKIQGKNLQGKNSKEFSQSENSCIIFDPKIEKIVAQSEDETNGDETSINHAVMAALQKFGEISQTEENSGQLGKREADSGYYVCSGLWALMYREPCVMCSMALTHSRIAKLVFLEEYNGYGCGGCNNEVQIFCDPRLNHKYKVYQYK